MTDTTTLNLPAGTHATTLHARDVVTGETLTEVVVWTDLSSGRCPRCDQPVRREPDCPLHLNGGAGQGGALETWDHMHGCGQWLEPPSEAVRGTGENGEVTEEDVLAVARGLAERLAEAHDERRAKIRRRLRRELTDALARLAEPLDDDETTEDRAEEVRSGDDMQPGVYHDGHQWVAWDFDPAGGEGEYLEVTENEVRA
jgi:hypothetical protein